MADVAWTDSDVYFRNADTIWLNHFPVLADISPAIQRDMIDPYSGGAWLWLTQIIVPGYDTLRIARNNEDVVYGEDSFEKFNLEIGEQVFSSDGSIPRVALRIFQDVNRVVEDMINETEGALGAEVKLIRVCENYLSTPIKALEADYENLAAESDSSWVTFLLGVPNPLTQRIPLEIYSSNRCQQATPSLFKGPACQYTGSDPSCTGTYEDCFAKGNAENWGGELGLDPKVIKG
jgi:phage-related protein